MHRESQRHYNLDDYYAVEETSSVRHEYYAGEIFAMAGSSVNHNHISANLLAALRTGLRDSGCSAFGNDLRLQTPGGLYTYPDVMVICGQIELTRDRPDTVMNPVLLVEVLSEATREYDRGEKFALYKEIPTLKDYVLIEQEQILVQHYWRSAQGMWTLDTVDSLGATLSPHAIAVPLPLAEIYRSVLDR
jgi:Uma2 family endonuclease